jgi:hypothetical protein
MEGEILIINENQMDWSEMIHGEKIYHRRKNFTNDLTTNKIVTSLYTAIS